MWASVAKWLMVTIIRAYWRGWAIAREPRINSSTLVVSAACSQCSHPSIIHIVWQMREISNSFVSPIQSREEYNNTWCNLSPVTPEARSLQLMRQDGSVTADLHQSWVETKTWKLIQLSLENLSTLFETFLIWRFIKFISSANFSMFGTFPPEGGIKISKLLQTDAVLYYLQLSNSCSAQRGTGQHQPSAMFYLECVLEMIAIISPRRIYIYNSRVYFIVQHADNCVHYTEI